MDLATRRRYQGFSLTPPLWTGDGVFPFGQIDLVHPSSADAASVTFKNHRLGKLVEEFVFHQLKSKASVTWISDNLQIQDNKRTAGEIDALYLENDTPIHLEVAYKFYLYDTIEEYSDPLAYWIGPNRKDSLFYKLEKLRGKQFPLLHHRLTRPYLDGFHLTSKDIKQQLCFKAQLFTPYQGQDINLGPINSNCVVGNYLSHRDISMFEGLRFHIPPKLDWLITPHHDVQWIGFPAFTKTIDAYVLEKRSPLVWVKHGAGDIRRWFVVFWHTIE